MAKKKRRARRTGKKAGKQEQQLAAAAVIGIAAFWFYNRYLGIRMRLPFTGVGELSCYGCDQPGFMRDKFYRSAGPTDANIYAVL